MWLYFYDSHYYWLDYRAHALCVSDTAKEDQEQHLVVMAQMNTALQHVTDDFYFNMIIANLITLMLRGDHDR